MLTAGSCVGVLAAGLSVVPSGSFSSGSFTGCCGAVVCADGGVSEGAAGAAVCPAGGVS